MSTKEKDKRVKELQVFSGIAILLVVLLHSNAFYLTNILKLEAYTQANFWVKLLNNIVVNAVAMFIFIAGYKYALNNTEDNYKEYVLKKIKNIFKPFIVLSIIFLIRNIIIYPESYAGTEYITKHITNIFIGINPAYHLWFIPMYLFVAITYPLIYKVFKNDIIRVIVIISLAFIKMLIGESTSLVVSQITFFMRFYLFYEMGVMFFKYNIKDKFKKIDKYIITLYFISLVLVSTIKDANLYGKLQFYLLSFLSISAYYFISIRIKENKMFNYLGKYSFYIYLFHEPIVLTNIASFLKILGEYNPVIYIFTTTLLSILISILIYKIIKCTFLKYIFFNSCKDKKVVSERHKMDSQRF